jgi:large subunit ribosomal protein L13
VKKSTHYAKTGEVERKWVLIDADGMTLGRLATQAAMMLRGKNKPQYTPNADTGDFVVVINADKVQLTGNKADKKSYWRYSGWLGGLKTELQGGHGEAPRACHRARRSRACSRSRPLVASRP